MTKINQNIMYILLCLMKLQSINAVEVFRDLTLKAKVVT